MILGLCGVGRHSNPHVNVAAGSILAQAVRSWRAGRATSYSRNKDKYRDLTVYHPALRYAVMIKAVEIVEAAGLIHHDKGRSWSNGGKNRQSRFWPTDHLLALVDGLPITAPRLRQVLRIEDQHGHLCAYPETGRTRAKRKTVLALNEVYRTLNLGIAHRDAILLDGYWHFPTKDGADTFSLRADAVELFRLFRDDLDHHGRGYGPWWQSAPKAIRSTITIDGEATASADFGNSHPRIAYALVGADPGTSDAYEVPGFEGEAGRKLIKVATNTALNDTGGRAHAIAAVAWDIAKRERTTETGSEDGAQAGVFDFQRAREAVEAVEQRHKAIAPLFYTGAGLRCMAIEADVVFGVAEAAAKRGIPVLTIHDECQGPASKHAEIVSLMHDEWSRRISAQPLVM